MYDRHVRNITPHRKIPGALPRGYSLSIKPCFWYNFRFHRRGGACPSRILMPFSGRGKHGRLPTRPRPPRTVLRTQVSNTIQCKERFAQNTGLRRLMGGRGKPLPYIFSVNFILFRQAEQGEETSPPCFLCFYNNRFEIRIIRFLLQGRRYPPEQRPSGSCRSSDPPCCRSRGR